MTEAETVLRSVGVLVETLACVGAEHSIDQEGLVPGGLFLHQMLSGPGVVSPIRVVPKKLYGYAVSTVADAELLAPKSTLCNTLFLKQCRHDPLPRHRQIAYSRAKRPLRPHCRSPRRLGRRSLRQAQAAVDR